MKNTISELNYTVEGIKSRLDEAEDLVSDQGQQVEKQSSLEKQEDEKRLEMNEGVW